VTATRASGGVPERPDGLLELPAIAEVGAVPAARTRSARPVRVLVVLAARSVEAGPVKGCFQFIAGLSAPDLEFHCVNFCTGPEDPKRPAFTRAAAAVGARMEFVTQSGRDYRSLFRQLDAIIRREGIDLIQSHGFKPAFLCAWLHLRHRLPWVCFGHGATTENWRVRCYNRVEDVVRLLADRTVFVSRAQRRGLLGRLRGSRIRVIHNAVDVDRPAPMSADGPAVLRRRLGLEVEDRLAVALGRLSPEKGLDVLIDALALDVDPPDGRLWLAIVGNGSEKERLAERVRQRHLEGRVRFIEHTATPGDYLAAADLVVLPSRSEGIPNVALEAMALGRPLVATAVGGTPEVVPDGVGGLLVPPNDPVALAGAMRRLMHEPALAASLAAGARAHAARELSVATRCSRLRAVYTELMPRLSAAGRGQGT
jgi:glycosyltransferase involved in cell wall biosynthesis